MLHVQVFVNERTDVLNSRTLGRLVQGFKSVEGYNNALSALKAAYVNVFGFFEAHPAVFSIEEEPEVGLGGFRVRLLQAAPPGVSAGSEKADNDLGEQEATAGAIVVADFSNSRSAATTTAGTQTAQWHSQADAVASKSSSSTSLSSVAASVAAAAIGRKTSAERHIVVSPDSAEQTPRQNRKKLVKYLSTLKVPELKVLLKAAKLPLTGSKVALIERLVEAENLQI